MPEGDTVWRTAHRLHQVFAGRPLTECDLRWPGLSTHDFTGAETLEVAPRGKHLLHRLDGGWTIHSHLRMEGSWRVEPTDAAPPPRAAKVRAVLATATYRAVGWSLGMLDVVRTADEGTLVGHLGPDLLGPDWDLDVAVAHLRASAAPWPPRCSTSGTWPGSARCGPPRRSSSRASTRSRPPPGSTPPRWGRC